MPCQACRLPETLDALSHAFLWPPQGHTLRKIARHLEERAYRFETDRGNSYLTAEVENANRFIVLLCGLLTRSEAADTRILLSDTPSPGFGEFGQIMTVEQMMRRKRGDWLIQLLKEGRYTSFRQPIVDLADGFAPIGHEYLFRGYDEDGTVLSPAALFESASDPRILFNLDRRARISAVETAARLPGSGKVFINFMPGSVYDPGVCLRTTVNAVHEEEISPERVIFEIVESERIEDLNHLRGIVNFYRAAGFRIALDDYGAGFNNLQTLMTLEPDYLKLDKAVIRDAASGGEAKRDMIAALAERCTRNGIRTIGEGVEDAETADMLARLGIDLAQGYHFGRPMAPEEAAARPADVPA
ncbi:EAL domain-containing protein [Marivibrio halodurans]|uniref:EAL domain-containing protein n=1 Tax=Marivibrio halodurans TaxID=2039722 RepID=A0A8J7V2Q1_9PROT|nr:EAL domain-containing protein [Marivibrio halodurans]MBP5859051.1 EAL domain-containing protein [Marivibrio halodurans]